MNPTLLIAQLAHNQTIFQEVLAGFFEDMIHWKPNPEAWSALEIMCHLIDEEREDFRTRVQHTLTTIELPPPPINPAAWVLDRKYQEQDFAKKQEEFFQERGKSLAWLRSLTTPNWEQAFVHPAYGARSALFYLRNWVAHDLLHQRQLTRLRYEFLRQEGADIAYAGTW